MAHKATTTALFGVFLTGGYTVINQVMEGKDGGGNKVEEHPQAGFINMLKTKAEEEYAKYYKIDEREWYDKDGEFFWNTFLKQGVGRMEGVCIIT